MAVQPITVTRLDAAVPTFLVAWTGLANGDTGRPLSLPDCPDMTATIEGTFGAGGSCTLKGSSDGVNYYALTDAQGNAVTKTSAGIEVLEEQPAFIRPEVTAGDGTTAIQVRIMARRASR